MKNIKKKIILGTILVSLIMLATPIINAQTNQSMIHPPQIRPIGAFQIIIQPPEETIEFLETLEIKGTHQLIPGALDNILPTLWMSQYSELDEESPDWIEVTFPQRTLITPPDGNKYTFSILITLTKDAPMNTVATIAISITTGKLMRTMFPSWFPMCNEFNLDQDILIRTGEW